MNGGVTLKFTSLWERGLPAIGLQIIAGKPRSQRTYAAP